MTTPQRLPVLFLTDPVVLPGMVVPIELDESAQAPIDPAPRPQHGARERRPRPSEAKAPAEED
ncbi:hypothetical protein [Nocardia wallacei]|uniref:hypothetical protein n=1 Tax=Nocardia wallacei TaxID=480035 RepID=UPI0024550576|nr:hypothetical protein [Nocardia wallacei]